MGKDCCETECCSNEEEPCCGVETQESCCQSDSCCDESGGFASGVLRIADDAWAELLKEKIKKAFEAKKGKKMDKIAEIAADAAAAYWDSKKKGKAIAKDHYAKLEQALLEE